MTAQASDKWTYDGEKYGIAGVNGEVFPEYMS